MNTIEEALRKAVLNLKPVLDWMFPIVNGRSDQWKGDRLKQAIAIAELPLNWDDLNYRRHELIDKQTTQLKLTAAEEKELAELQEVAGKVRDAFTPDFPRTRISMTMPLDAMLRLKVKFEQDPEGVKKYFREQGFDIEQILFPSPESMKPTAC